MFKVDLHQPSDIVRGLDMAYDIEVWDAINNDAADYFWDGESLSYIPNHDGTYMTEHKTIDDVVRDSDGVESQLRKYVTKNPRSKHRLILEGLWEPAPTGVLIYRRKPGTNMFFGGQKGVQPQLAKKIVSWLGDLYDITEVWMTPTMSASITTLGYLYMHDQKPESERTIMRRHLKSIDWHENPQVMRLMGMAGNDTGLGVSRCEALIRRFGTAWNVCSATPSQLASVPGIGQKTAVEFLQKIGRPDV